MSNEKSVAGSLIPLYAYEDTHAQISQRSKLPFSTKKEICVCDALLITFDIKRHYVAMVKITFVDE